MLPPPKIAPASRRRPPKPEVLRPTSPPRTSRTRRLTAHAVRQIAVEAVCSERTVRRLYEGLPVRETSALRILRAIETLRLPSPPPPTMT
jgi:hypothetical protein